MLNHFIYSTPIWLWGATISLFFVGLSVIGLIIFHRLVPVDLREAHNELVGFTVAIVAVVYAVLLAFIAVATWESYSRAQELVDVEAAHVGNIYRDTLGLQSDMAELVRTDLKEYVDTVINKEWPVQQKGESPNEGWTPLYHLHDAIVQLHPTTMGEQVVEAELLKVLNELYGARASRLSAVEGHIPDAVWLLILLGGMITTGYTYLFGFKNFKMHMVITSTVSLSLVLVVVLIMALDWPFRGEVSVSSDAFVKVEKSWSDMKVRD